MRHRLSFLSVSRAALLAAPLALAILGSPARADDDDDAERAWRGAQAGRLMPLPHILERVQNRFPGEVLDVDLDEGTAPEYEIRLLMPNGRVLEIEVDARDGRILDVDEDD